jgi:DNA-binding transcriptional LysR family regulator
VDALDRMETYVRVIEAGSLSGAARARGLSVAAVSRQLGAIEAELGVVLIVRTTRRLQPTEAGLRWYAHCARILDQVRAARDDVRDEVGGRLVLSVPVTFGLSMVVPRLSELRRRHPELLVDLRIEDRPVDLVGDGVDAAIRAGLEPPDSPGLVARRIARVLRTAVASPGYLAQRGRPALPADLASHDCLVQLSFAGPLARWTFAKDGREVVVDVSGPLRATAPLALQALARGDLGVAWVPEGVAEDDLQSGALERVLPGWQSPPSDIWLLHRVEHRSSPRLAALLDVLRSPTDAG